jgi:hypothetical protein
VEAEPPAGGAVAVETSASGVPDPADGMEPSPPAGTDPYSGTSVLASSASSSS